MSTVEAFLQEFFDDRTRLLRQSVTEWEAHIDRFFARGYRPYDRHKAVAESASERIESITGSDISPEVITTGSTGGLWRARYQLTALNSAWIITSMEMECNMCRGTGNSKSGTNDCRFCVGRGWRLVGDKHEGA